MGWACWSGIRFSLEFMVRIVGSLTQEDGKLQKSTGYVEEPNCLIAYDAASLLMYKNIEVFDLYQIH
jgi:hypothetical protein